MKEIKNFEQEIVVESEKAIVEVKMYHSSKIVANKVIDIHVITTIINGEVLEIKEENYEADVIKYLKEIIEKIHICLTTLHKMKFIDFVRQMQGLGFKQKV